MFMFKMSNDTYDKLKWVMQYGLPAVAVVLGIVGKTYDIDTVTTAATVLMAIDTALGGVLGVSTKDYQKMLDEIDASTRAEQQ